MDKGREACGVALVAPANGPANDVTGRFPDSTRRDRVYPHLAFTSRPHWQCDPHIPKSLARRSHRRVPNQRAWRSEISPQCERDPAGGPPIDFRAGGVFLIRPDPGRVGGVQARGVVVSPLNSVVALTAGCEDGRTSCGEDRRAHRVLGIAGRAHHDDRRGEFLLRCSCAAETYVAVRVDRQRGDEVIALRVVDEAFL